MFAVGILVWAFIGFCLGFEDIRDWFVFTVLAVGSGWGTANGLHRLRR